MPASPVIGGGSPLIVLDCRWLGLGGAGRVTELTLVDLRAHRPPWPVVLWGDPERLQGFADLGEIVIWRGGFPGSRLGQAGFRTIPASDLVVFFHQVRPLVSRSSISFVHDTIPLRYGGSLLSRRAKRWFLRRVVRSSARIITVSAFARDSITRDLEVDPRRVDVAAIPIEGPRFDAIAARRREGPIDREALYVGRLAPHKNIPRLLAAFVASSFGQRGGRLVLVGGSGEERERLERTTLGVHGANIEMLGPCSEAELDRRLARSQLLVMPSLEEGFGLPPFEAAAVGLPVAVSKTGGMGGIPPSNASFCDPLDTRSIAEAIDAAAARMGVAPIYRHPGNLASTLITAVEKALVESR